MTPPPCPLTEQELADFVRQLMAEDGLDPDTGQGDVTSQAVIPQDAVLAAEMAARERIVVCGLPVAVEVFKHLEPGCQVDLFKQDGQMAAPGEALLTVAGRARAILSGERAALNVVQHLSGIATLTHRYVDAIAGTGARLLDTRKTVPGLRKLAKYATACGGAHNHRMDLSEAVLIKDNHLGLAGGVQTAVAEARARGQVDVEVECDTLEQVEAALGRASRPHPAGQHGADHAADGGGDGRRTGASGSLGRRHAGHHPRHRRNGRGLHLGRPHHPVRTGGGHRPGLSDLTSWQSCSSSWPA